MALGRALEAGLAVIRDDALLDVVGVGGDEAEAPRSGTLEYLVQRQHRGAGRDAGLAADAPAQRLVGLKAKPPGRGAIPADHLHLGVGEKLRGTQDLAVVEL